MGQFKPVSGFGEPGTHERSAVSPDVRTDDSPCAADSDAAALAPEIRDILDATVELSALALALPSTFICLGLAGKQRLVANHRLPASAVQLAETLSKRCARSAGRIAWPANLQGEGTSGEQGLWIVAPLTLTGGKPRGTFGCCSDAPSGKLTDDQERIFNLVCDQLSGRLEAQEAMRESRQHYRFAMELDPLLRWTADAQGNLLDLNDRWQELTGGTRVRALGGAWRAYVHTDDRNAALTAFETALRQGTPIDIKFRLRAPGAEWRWTRTRARARRDADGALLRWYGTTEDIHDQVIAERVLRESEEHYRYSVELNPQVPWTALPDGSIEEVGPTWEDFTGTNLEQARGHGWTDAVHPDDIPTVIERWQATLASGEPIDIDYRLRRGDGNYRWVRARAAPRFDSAGEIVRWYGTLEDIDDHRHDQDALRQSEERFRLAAQAARLGIWDYDLELGTRECSDELRRILGLPADVEVRPEMLLALVHPDDQQRIGAIARTAAMPGSDQRFEITFRILRASNGELRWICANGWRTDSALGQPSRILVAVRDITEARTADDRIRWAARHDMLTRLPNRAAFHDALNEAMDRSLSPGDSVGLLLIDVDHLKQTNDCLGHDAGDALLETIADRLKAIAGERGFTARLGGDEFALLFSGYSAEADMTRASDALGPLLAEAFVHEGRILDCRATCGGSRFPQDGANGAELLKAADLALYAAKAEARGGLLMFRPEMRSDLERRSSMISMAREAIDDERVTPFYQPKVELDSGRLVGFEALLRWHHPGTGLRPPGEISAAFDNLDLALALSDRMFDQAITHMRRWLDDGVAFGTVAINAASAEFRRDDLAERILERLARAAVPATLLELEVTETVFLGAGADHVDRALKTLSAAGVKIALDDFGTGYASLSHLKQYSVDTIKIDRSFVCNLESATGDAAIVNAVINLGVSLGLDIVAEGIETQAQANYLLRQGCAFGQGYLFGRAAPPETIPTLVSTWTAHPVRPTAAQSRNQAPS